MSDDRFDVLERFERLVQAPEPSFEGFIRRRDRKRRNQRIAAGVVAIAIFAAPVAWMVATGGGSDRTFTPATTGPTVVTDDAVRVVQIDLPPEGATPSTPASGELLFGSMFGHTMGDHGRSFVYVYADGRLIWERSSGDFTGDVRVEATGLLERRLTPEGVELVMAEVISSGLFDHDLNLGGAPGLYFGQIEARKGDRLVHVYWGDVHPENVTPKIPTPEQVSALQRLDSRLADPASWLPSSAWVDPENKTYVPPRYEVCYNTAQPRIGLSRVLASFPQPAEDLLRTRDRTHNETVDPFGAARWDTWCSHVTTEEVRALARILEDAGSQENGHPLGTTFLTYVRVVNAPLLPHQG